MKLTTQDYMNIAAQIEKGKNEIDYKIGDLVLSIECTFEQEGEVEDDYFNGTGAFVETDRSLFIEKCEVVDEDGKATPIEIDGKRLESLIA